MPRNHNTDRDGRPFSEDLKQNVWNKGRIIPDFSSDIWRWDKCGDVIKWSDFGNRESKFGWEIGLHSAIHSDLTTLDQNGLKREIFDAKGKEIFRQMGAMEKDKIAAKLKEIGVRA